MSKYVAVYKCFLCGKEHRMSNPVELSEEQLPELLGKFVRNQQFAGHPALYQAPQHLPCKCSDGSGGLAYFIGFKKV